MFTKRVKYEVELCCLDFPETVYKCGYSSTGQGMMVERFNLLEMMHNDFEDYDLVNFSLVLAIDEKAFPHTLNFSILEPASNLLWSYTYRDSRL
jgi:hypothetical protein